MNNEKLPNVNIHPTAMELSSHENEVSCTCSANRRNKIFYNILSEKLKSNKNFKYVGVDINII
jgi:uncharacterized protein CbrC (UPF0167 family)